MQDKFVPVILMNIYVFWGAEVHLRPFLLLVLGGG
jgi:hypothetical protein